MLEILEDWGFVQLNVAEKMVERRLLCLVISEQQVKKEMLLAIRRRVEV